MCCMCPSIVADLCLSLVQSSGMARSACCGQGFISVLLMGQSRAHLGLSLLRPAVCQSFSVTELQGTLPALSPQVLLLVGGACSQTRCLPPAHCWGCSQTGVCGFLPHSWDRSHFGVVLVRQGCLYAARLVTQLWMDFC